GELQDLHGVLTRVIGAATSAPTEEPAR
ncbi:MAG: hypothetical protein QOG96_5932, partial [Pseudonocardiales bacterium]|nr:hypothetical protein [Pseudonocardiales bacterium]